MKRYTFEDLNEKTPPEIARIKQDMLDELAEVRQQRFNDIASILFYQQQIEKETADEVKP